jgi:hypothetical protein
VITVPSGVAVIVTVPWMVLTHHSYWRHP